MDDRIGYGRPPAATRFQKGKSGNPGGTPGPQRAAEKRLQGAVERAMLADPVTLFERKPKSRVDALAQALVCSAALMDDLEAVDVIYQLLPERRHRARLPARLRRALAEAERADAQSQGISAA